MYRSHSFIYVFCLSAWTLGASATAHAICVAEPGEPLWTYPADGATDIPLDADLLLLRAGAYRRADVTLDGEPLVRGETTFESYDLGALAPRTTYSVAITVHYEDINAAGDSATTTTTLKFTTGEHPMGDADESPTIASAERWTIPFDPQRPCHDILYMDTCFDTGRPDALQLTPQETPKDAVLWQVVWKAWGRQYARFVPVSCGEPTAVAEVFDPPYVLHAVYPNGESRESKPFKLTPAEPGPVGSDPSETGGDAAMPADVDARAAEAGIKGTRGANSPSSSSGSGCNAARPGSWAFACFLLAWAVLLNRGLGRRRS